MTGRLQGRVFGRPVELVAAGSELSLRLADVRSAWRLRGSAKASLRPLLHALRVYGVVLRVKIGSRFEAEVLPNPSFLVRLLLPNLDGSS